MWLHRSNNFPSAPECVKGACEPLTLESWPKLYEAQITPPIFKVPTVDGLKSAPCKKPWNDDSPVNTNKRYGFNPGSKWCELDFVHPQYFDDMRSTLDVFFFWGRLWPALRSQGAQDGKHAYMAPVAEDCPSCNIWRCPGKVVMFASFRSPFFSIQEGFPDSWEGWDAALLRLERYGLDLWSRLTTQKYF